MILILILLLHQRREEVREVGGRADADADADADDAVDIITHVAHSHRQHGHAGRRSARRLNQVSGSSAERNWKKGGSVLG